MQGVASGKEVSFQSLFWLLNTAVWTLNSLVNENTRRIFPVKN
jgi:hypothetical protein